MNYQYNKQLLTTEELAERIKYNPRYIREVLKDSVFIEGVHYIRPFGRRKILFVWDAIERDMFSGARSAAIIPMASGGAIRG